MMKSKAFWYSLMAGSLVGWVVIITGAVAALTGSPFVGVSRIVWLALTIVWCALHPFEIPLSSWRVGKERGIKPAVIIVKTLAYGFTWWLPLKNGVIAR